MSGVTYTWVFGDRWYLYEDTGEKVPGVSAIKDIVSKPALERWKINNAATYCVDHVDVVRQVAADDREAALTLVRDAAKRAAGRAADQGTDVHTNVEQLTRDMLAGRKSTFHVAPGDMRFLRNFARFVKEFNVRPRMVETVVWSEEHRYAGRLDLGATLTVDGVDVDAIVDTKSGASGVWPDAAIQQVAYLNADHYIDNDGLMVPVWLTGFRPVRAFALWLRPNGWALHPLDTGAETWSEFLRRRGNYEWRLTLERKAVGKAINQRPLARPFKRKGK